MNKLFPFFLSIFLCLDVSAHEEAELYAYKLHHSIKQKYLLLIQVKEEAARKVIACSIVSDTENLGKLVEVEVPKSISSKELLDSLSRLASEEKEHLLKSGIKNKYGC